MTLDIGISDFQVGRSVIVPPNVGPNNSAWFKDQAELLIGKKFKIISLRPDIFELDLGPESGSFFGKNYYHFSWRTYSPEIPLSAWFTCPDCKEVFCPTNDWGM